MPKLHQQTAAIQKVRQVRRRLHRRQKNFPRTVRFRGIQNRLRPATRRTSES